VTEVKKLFIKTYGCQMNVYDTARMRDVLAPLGYTSVETPDGADVVVLNTCHIREKAAEKVFSDLGRLKPYKKAKADDGGYMIIAVAGCVGQAEGEALRQRMPYVDIVLGPQTYHRLPEMVTKVLRELASDSGKPKLVLDTDFPVEAKFDQLPMPEAEGPSAFLAIQEGCDRFCTYCVVPYTRGAEYARPVIEVLNEAQHLVDSGACEITLLGQNVNAWAGENKDGNTWSFARLLHGLAEIDGLDRIRYTTSHPKDVSDELIAAHRDLEKLVPFLHLPVQAGSDKVLKGMNRGHTAADYRRTVDKFMTARPDLKLSSDFIVGFPGESDQDFQDTVNLAKEIGFVQTFSFKYSPRPGTPAATMPNQIDEAVKVERLAILQDALMGIQQDFNKSCIGMTMPLLFERHGRKPGHMVGRSPYMQPVFAEAPEDIIGQIRTVKIIGLGGNSLEGTLLLDEEPQVCASNNNAAE